MLMHRALRCEVHASQGPQSKHKIMHGTHARIGRTEWQAGWGCRWSCYASHRPLTWRVSTILHHHPTFFPWSTTPILSLRTDCWPCHVLCMAMLCCAVLCSVEDSIDDSLDEALLYVTANRVGVFRRGKSKCKVVSTQPVTLAAQHQQLPER